MRATSDMQPCPHADCEHENSATARYCANCGRLLNRGGSPAHASDCGMSRCGPPTPAFVLVFLVLPLGLLASSLFGFGQLTCFGVGLVGMVGGGAVAWTCRGGERS